MQPEDIIWRLSERLNEFLLLCEESISHLHPKNSDLISSMKNANVS